ncbi:unnamed protein product [Allacma fusca]|uniref:Uncharacterized protein n=1 Tax=Allacma fusca TaxID=39272 RepID=A0A8J2L3K9_9HEXA|nr:unnamed protein product [Allacma fusca]
MPTVFEQTTEPSAITVIRKITTSKSTGRIGIRLEAGSVLVGDLTAKNELGVFLVLRDNININNHLKNSPLPSQFCVNVLLKHSNKRYVIHCNKIIFPLSAEHILAIYFIKIMSMLQKLNINATEEIAVMIQESNAEASNAIQKSLAIIKSAGPSLFASQPLYRFVATHSSDDTSSLDSSSSYSVLERLLQFLDLTNDVKIDSGEFNNYTVNPPSEPHLSPEQFKLIEQSVARAVEEGLKTHKKFMYSVTGRKEPFTDTQLKNFHDNNLRSIAATFAENFKELASSYSSIASCIKEAQDKLEKKTNLQLMSYLKRYETSIKALTEKVKHWIMEAECLYDEEMEEFNPEERTSQEIRTKHAELELQFMTWLKQKFTENKLEWQEFWKFEPQEKLSEKLEEHLATAQKDTSNFGDTLSSLSSPMLVLKSIQRVQNSSLSYGNSMESSPRAPPNSLSNFEDSESLIPGGFTSRDEHYLKDHANYEEPTTDPFIDENFEGRGDAADQEEFNHVEEEDPPLQFTQEVSYSSDLSENNSIQLGDLEENSSNNLKNFEIQSGGDMEELLEPANEPVEVETPNTLLSEPNTNSIEGSEIEATSPPNLDILEAVTEIEVETTLSPNPNILEAVTEIETTLSLNQNILEPVTEIKVEATFSPNPNILEAVTETEPIDETIKNIVLDHESVAGSCIHEEKPLAEEGQNSTQNSTSEIERQLEEAGRDTCTPIEELSGSLTASSTSVLDTDVATTLTEIGDDNVLERQRTTLEGQKQVPEEASVNNESANAQGLQQSSEQALALESVTNDELDSPRRNSNSGNSTKVPVSSASGATNPYDIEGSDEDIPTPTASPIFTENNHEIGNTSTQAVMDEILEECCEKEGRSQGDISVVRQSGGH